MTRSPASDPVLRAADLRVERGDRTVLDGVSLTVASGDRVLVRGPSGAGKTTLFHALALLERPTSGTLVVDGTEAAGASERTLARLRREAVGVVFQDFHLVPDLTVRENVALPQEHAGERDAAWIDHLLDELAIEDLADAYPATLSGGEAQRVATARALANRPRVVLADEPTGQLDPDAGARLLDLLDGVQVETGCALVVVSHDPALADRFEDVRWLEGGTLRRAETAADSPDEDGRVGSDEGDRSPAAPDVSSHEG